MFFRVITFGFGEGDFAFGEFAGVDFFEHVDEDFGLDEVWIGMEAGFNQAEFEEFFGDEGEVGARMVRLESLVRRFFCGGRVGCGLNLLWSSSRVSDRTPFRDILFGFAAAISTGATSLISF